MHKACISLLAKCGSAQPPNLPDWPPRPPLRQKLSSLSLMSENNNVGATNSGQYFMFSAYLKMRLRPIRIMILMN